MVPNYLIGLFLLANYLLVVFVKVSLGKPEDLVWLSHAALLLSTIAFLKQDKIFFSIAITLVMIPHSIWLIDFFSYMMTGTNPLGVTIYFKSITPFSFLATMHHFYLLPLLLFVGLKRFSYSLHGFIYASLIFWFLSIMSVFASPQSSNINYAFEIFPQLDVFIFQWINSLGMGSYLLALIFFCSMVIFLPAAVFLYVFFGERYPAINHELA